MNLNRFHENAIHSWSPQEAVFAKATKTPRYADDVKLAIQRLLVEAPLPRDALPYTSEFAALKTKYEAETNSQISEHDFWQLLSKIGKYGAAGGAAGRKTAPRTKSLTTEQELEILRLFPDGIGHRDNLPYTPEFDELHKRFQRLTGTRLTPHEFWRAMSRVAKLSRKPKPVFDTAPLGGLPSEIVQYLERLNPWWRAQHSAPTERFRRWAFGEAMSRLDARIAPVVAIRGPRQVGKTTIQLQIIEELLLIRHVPPGHILRVQFDDIPSLGNLANPVDVIVRWFEEMVLRATINGMAARGERVYLLFDELQNLHGWSAQLKSLVDHTDANVLVTGSSALRIARGHDNLAGRVSTIELGPLRLNEIAGVRGLGELPPFACPNAYEDWAKFEYWQDLNSHARKHGRVLREAFGHFSALGGYPVCHKQAAERTSSLLAGQLVEDVIKKSIDFDPVRVGSRVQLDRNVIREVFRLVCRYTGQAVTTQELERQISGVLGTGVKYREIGDAVQFLADALLIHCVPPLELLGKKQPNPSKLCLCDHFVRNAWLQETIPLAPDALQNAPEAVASIAGHIAEGVVGYQLKGFPSLEVAWFPERPTEPEVDLVLTLGLKRLPIEVKYQATKPKSSDWCGLTAFCGRQHYGAEFGLIITREAAGVLAPQVVAVPLPNFLLAI